MEAATDKGTFAPAFSRTITAVGGTLLLTATILPAVQGPWFNRVLAPRILEAAGPRSGLVERFLPPETFEVYVANGAAPGDEAAVDPGDLVKAPGTGASPSQILCALAISVWERRGSFDLETARWTVVAGFILALLVQGLSGLLVGLSGRGAPMGASVLGYLLGLTLALLGSATAPGFALGAKALSAILDPRGSSFALGGLLLCLLGALVGLRREVAKKALLVAAIPIALAGVLGYGVFG